MRRKAQWFRVKDLGRYDDDGYLYHAGRADDVIISAGWTMSAVEIENTLLSHPDIAEAAAIGVPHPKWDERPILMVVPQPGKNPDPDSVIDLLRPHFAKWQLPDEVLFVDQIPHTATGKISKLSIRRKLEAEGYKLPDQR